MEWSRRGSGPGSKSQTRHTVTIQKPGTWANVIQKETLNQKPNGLTPQPIILYSNGTIPEDLSFS